MFLCRIPASGKGIVVEATNFHSSHGVVILANGKCRQIILLRRDLCCIKSSLATCTRFASSPCNHVARHTGRVGRQPLAAQLGRLLADQARVLWHGSSKLLSHAVIIRVIFQTHSGGVAY